MSFIIDFQDILDVYRAQRDVYTHQHTIEDELSAPTSKPKPPDPPSDGWIKLLKDFTQDTTLHGIRYTTLNTRFVIRKLIWLLILFGAFGVFIFYMVERLQEYLLFKKNVSVEENYVDKMDFPAITICNQNPFRITVAANAGWYSIAKQLTKEDSEKINLRACIEDTEFQCRSQDCIPKINRCDSFPDCEDGSDELECGKCVRLLVQSGGGGGLGLQIPNVTSATFDLLSHTYKTGDYPVYVKKNLDNPVYLFYDKSKHRWTFSAKVSDTAVVFAWAAQNVSTPNQVNVPWVNAVSGKTGQLNFSCVNPAVKPPLAGGTGNNDLFLDILYRSGATPYNDFMQSCSWKNNKCSEGAFTEVITDMGVCYTFTQENDMFVGRSGPGFGLRVTLNIEQFEYTKDPQTGVGIRVLLHKPTDVPLMQGRAFAISPGLNTMVAIEKTNVNNLEPPWGNCTTKELLYFTKYSVTTCQMDCENVLAREQCGCRDINMPLKDKHDTGTCTVQKFVDCLHPKITAMRKNMEGCVCPTPCEETVYVPSLSFASISTDDDIIKSRQREKKFAEMQKSLTAAREISYRVLDDKYRSTLRMFQMVELRVSSLLWALRGASVQLQDQQTAITNVGRLVSQDCLLFSKLLFELSTQLKMEVMRNVDDYLKYFSHQVITSFTHFRDVLADIEAGPTANEQAYLNTRTGKIRFTQYDTEILLNNTVFNADHVGFLTRNNIKIKTQADLTAVVDANTTISVLDNVTLGMRKGSSFYSDLRVSSVSGKLTGSYADVWLTDEDFWKHTSSVWLRLAGCRTAYQSARTTVKRISGKLKDRLRKTVVDLTDSNYRLVKDRAELLLQGSHAECAWCMTSSGGALFTILRTRLTNFLDGFLNDTVGELETALSDVYNQVLKAEIAGTSKEAILTQTLPDLLTKTEEVGQNIFDQMFKTTQLSAHVIEELLRLLSPKCETELPKKLAEYHDAHFRVQSSVTGIRKRLTEYHEKITSYQQLYVNRNMSLTEVANQAGYDRLRADVEIAATTTENALKDASQLVKRVNEHINMVYFWFLAQTNDSYLANNSHYWRHFGMKGANVTLPVDGMLEAMLPNEKVVKFWNAATADLSMMVDNVAFHLVALRITLDEATTYTRSFIEGNLIGEQFFKKNFLQMDIFYKALTDKKVTQQKAYEYPALLSELGGLLGLLLGASSITVVELLDLLIYNTCVKCKEWRQRRRAFRHKGPPPAPAANHSTISVSDVMQDGGLSSQAGHYENNYSPYT